jgi:diguanylate cyclase (GGDEF)-like protein
MTTPALRVLTLLAVADETRRSLETSAFGPFTVLAHDAARPARDRLVAEAFDALILDADTATSLHRVLEQTAADAAVLVVCDEPNPGTTIAWLQRGVQQVLRRGDLSAEALPGLLRSAIERKRLEREGRKAYATDVRTGLPHQQQLIEHMSHLLALREREPAPMAVLVLRIEGLATTQARLGSEAANVLLRKIAVRLRAGVRASDVVASIGDDSFAVLLASILTPADAQRVGAKLLLALNAPTKVAGNEIAVAVALGIGQYPQDGAQPDALLRRAVGLAASAQAVGRAGLSNFHEASGRTPGAANDD